MLSPIAKQILAVQKSQFTMGLKWIALIESPLTSSEDRAVAVEQLGVVNEMICNIAADIADYTSTHSLC